MPLDPRFGGRSKEPLYVPPWWERRWPWLVGFLIGLDPEPLLGVFGRALRPVTFVVEIACVRLAAGLEWASTLFATLGASIAGAALALGRALPVPPSVVSRLWLGPVHLDDGAASAQVMWRRRQRTISAVGLIIAVALHAAAFAFWPAMRAEDFSTNSGELAAIEIPPEVVIPPPPEAIARPATPVIAAADVAEDITIAPTTFEDNPVQDLPPPRVEEEAVLDDQPTFTPYTVAPRILNADEVLDRMAAEYPPLLLSAGVGGSVLMWFHLDDEGGILDMRIAEGSGHETLDAAAFRVAEGIRFSPALNRDEHVAVWVQFPIRFEVR